MMKAKQVLPNLSPSIWLDDIRHHVLDMGTLKTFDDESSVHDRRTIDREFNLHLILRVVSL